MENTSDVSQHLRKALLLLEGHPHQEPEHSQSARRHIKGTAQAWEFFKEMGDLEQEELWVIALNNSLEIVGFVKLYRGNATLAVVRPAEVFREAVRLGATAIAIAHNHPGGDPRPSSQDLEVTRAVGAAGRILDIPLLDHLVIGRQGYTSIMGQCLTDTEGQKRTVSASPTQDRSWVERIEL
ncbi:MAG TPA: JAB domain-containing protein [Dehalococcoidia bacterium]|nr:JAB domain-containing protein [Dehalococcoidia bacterium]